ncbi:MAG TPA: hypothetical protein VLH08_12495 [Acidobacteriota bacterium]|nr:hypothetical protein [Acidobacteriota bacterium]
MDYHRAGKFFLFLFIVFLSISTANATIRIDKKVVGLEGYIRNDRWIPVVFQVSNYISEFRGTLEILRGETIFKKSLEIGPASSRRIEILVYMSNYSEPLAYRIRNLSGRVVTEGKLNQITLNYLDNLVVVVSDTDYNHQFLNGVQNPWGGKTFVSYVKPSELFSNFIAYSSADAIAIGSLSTAQLDPASWQNLLLYGASGGTLITSPFTDFSVLQDPSLRKFLPRISPELSEMSHGEFLQARWTAKSTDPFPEVSIPAQKTETNGSQLILAERIPGDSLITSTPFFKGNIIHFSFDYSRLPEIIRSQFAGYWNETIFPAVAAPPMFGNPYRARLEDNPRVQRDLYNIPGLQLPHVKWFALFFFAYLMIIGPFQYLLLNFFKKNAMLWTTFPLIILVFTGAAIGYSKVRQSREGKITQVAVIEGFPTLHNEITYQVYGSAVSDSGTFDFQAVPENSYITKAVRQRMNYQMEPFVLSEDYPHTLSGESLKSFTFRIFDAISTQPESHGVEISAQIDGKRLYGTVRNKGRFHFKEAFFFYDRQNSATLGKIEPGEVRNFNIELNNRSVIPMAEPHLRTLLDLDGVSHSRPHFFFGETSKEKGILKINTKDRTTECIRYVAIYVPISANAPSDIWTPTTYQTPRYP